MFEELNIRVVEDFLKERVTSFQKLSTIGNYCAFLLVTEEEKYILKGNLTRSVKEDYINHQTVYNLYENAKEQLPFSITKPYFYSKEGNFYLTQYISGGVSLSDVVVTHPLAALDKTFFKAGEVLLAYHLLLSGNSKNDVFYFDNGRVGKLSSTHCFSPGDFTLANLVIDDNMELWIEDFTNFSVNFVPRKKDISFFINSSKELIFKERFLASLFAKKRVLRLMESFYRGYGEDFFCKSEKVPEKSNKEATLVTI